MFFFRSGYTWRLCLDALGSPWMPLGAFGRTWIFGDVKMSLDVPGRPLMSWDVPRCPWSSRRVQRCPDVSRCVPICL